MKKLFLLFILSFGINFACSASNSLSNGDHLSVLKNTCGLQLSRMLMDSISSSTVHTFKENTTVTLDMTLRISGKNRSAKLMLGCKNGPASKDDINVDLQGKQFATTLSPRQVLVEEDAGGRYARIVQWERPYLGDGWKGTIAFVKFVFGDRAKIPIPGFFIICPLNNRLNCTTFEILGGRQITNRESELIVNLLKTIRYTH